MKRSPKRGPRAGAVTLEYLHADSALEQLNAPANSGLREVQHVRGPAETAALDNDECVLEIA
jgi:hypothetical protein